MNILKNWKRGVRWCTSFLLASNIHTKAHQLIHVTSKHIVADLRYATADNFTKVRLYPENTPLYLHNDAAQRLTAAAAEFAQHGLKIKVWDAYRPFSVQKKMWNIVPDEKYVCNPSKGGYHTRGVAIDITLIDASGNEVTMPSPFDCFDERAHATPTKSWPEQVRRNVHLLKTIMKKHGFTQYKHEWWHFTLFPLENYPVLDVPFEDLVG